MGRTLDIKQKPGIALIGLLAVVLILSFLPISYESAYYHREYTNKYSSSMQLSSITECSLLQSHQPLNYYCVIVMLASVALNTLAVCKVKGFRKTVFWSVLAVAIIYGILCIMIQSTHTYDHDEDGMWGMALIGVLLLGACVLSAVIQFKKFEAPSNHALT